MDYSNDPAFLPINNSTDNCEKGGNENSDNGSIWKSLSNKAFDVAIMVHKSQL